MVKKTVYINKIFGFVFLCANPLCSILYNLAYNCFLVLKLFLSLNTIFQIKKPPFSSGFFAVYLANISVSPVNHATE